MSTPSFAHSVSGTKVLVAGPLFAHQVVFTRSAHEATDAEAHAETARTVTVPAGAGRLARMLATWGASVHLAGLYGDDAAGRMIAESLQEREINIDTLVIDETIQTPLALDVFAGEMLSAASPVTSTRAPQPSASPAARRELEQLCAELIDTVDMVFIASTDTRDVSTEIATTLAGEHSVQIRKIPIEQIDRLPVTHPPFEEKAQPIHQLQWTVEQIREFGGRICFTNGCFDLLHAGHVAYLREASQQADCFVLALNSDESVRTIKGPSRPVLDEQDRISVLSALECVDYITVFDTENVIPLLDVLRPEVYVKGGDYTIETINQVERRFLEGYSADIVLLSAIEGASTTEILRKIHENDLH